jgi:hypothetical protein
LQSCQIHLICCPDNFERIAISNRMSGIAHPNLGIARPHRRTLNAQLADGA